MSEDALLRRIQDNDPQALQEFVHQELPRVYNLCVRLCHNTTEAEDLSQTVFTRALAGIKNFRGEAKISTWLHRITLNVWKNWIRYEKNRKKNRHFSFSSPNKGDGEDINDIELPEKNPTPDAWAEISDDHKRVLEALDQLDEEQKSIIVLRDMEDYSYEDIAKLLNMNLGTVKSRLSRAREQLRVLYHRLEGHLL